MPGWRRFVRIAGAVLVLSVSFRILATAFPWSTAHLVIDVTSDVTGYSQVFVSAGDAPFSEEHSVRADLVVGANRLVFPFSVTDGTAGDAVRWDPANFPGSFVVSGISVTTASGTETFPLSRLSPAMDLLSFVPSEGSTRIETGSYDGQTLIDADLMQPAVEQEVLVWAGCLLLAAGVVAAWVIGGLSRRSERWTANGPTLAESFDPRSNALNFIRLVLATLVIASHTGFLAGVTDGPTFGFIGEGLTVDAFFAISGFLMARTLLRRGGVTRYLWHRVTRLGPAFWSVFVAVGFVVAPLSVHFARATQPDLWGGTDTPLGYVWRNASLWLVQPGIAGGPTGVPTGGNWNGSVWTMGWVLFCDLALVTLAVWGLLRRRWPVAVIAWMCWAALAWGQWNRVGALEGEWTTPLRLSLMFTLGVLSLLLATRVPMRWWLVLGGTAALVGSEVLLDDDYRLLGAPFLVYVVLWLSCRLPIRIGSRTDLSYGLYLFGWPAQQVLALLGLTWLGWWAFTGAAIAVALPAAAACWFLVERPFMRAREWSPAWLGRVPVPSVWVPRLVLPALVVAYVGIWATQVATGSSG